MCWYDRLPYLLACLRALPSSEGNIHDIFFAIRKSVLKNLRGTFAIMYEKKQGKKKTYFRHISCTKIARKTRVWHNGVCKTGHVLGEFRYTKSVRALNTILGYLSYQSTPARAIAGDLDHLQHAGNLGTKSNRTELTNGTHRTNTKTKL